MDNEMAEAVQRQMAAAQRSASIDRTGWTDDEWVADARRLMNEPDGSIMSLVNGHVMALLRRAEQPQVFQIIGREETACPECGVLVWVSFNTEDRDESLLAAEALEAHMELNRCR